MQKVFPSVFVIVGGVLCISILVKRSIRPLTEQQIKDELREVLLHVLSPDEAQEILISYRAVPLAQELGKESSREILLETIQKLLWDARKGRIVYGFFREYGFSHEQAKQLKQDRGIERLWDLVKGGLNAKQLQGLYILSMKPLSETM